jgi:hypothetical protein
MQIRLSAEQSESLSNPESYPALGAHVAKGYEQSIMPKENWTAGTLLQNA